MIAELFGQALGRAMGEAFVRAMIIAVLIALALAGVAALYGLVELIFGKRRLGAAALLSLVAALLASRAIHQPWPLLLYCAGVAVVISVRLVAKLAGTVKSFKLR